METFKYDPQTRDIVIADDNIDMVSGYDEIKQSIRLVLLTNLNEWFLDTNMGLDYSVIQQKDPDENLIRSALSDAIEQEDRVDSIETIDFNFDRDKRHMIINVGLTLDDGLVMDDSIKALFENGEVMIA